VERWNRLHPAGPRRTSHVGDLLGSDGGPVIAVTDYMKSLPDQIAPYVDRRFVSLGTDGFGRSDTREALRNFFEVDAAHIEVAVLAALAESGAVDPSVVVEALAAHGIDPDTPDPLLR
jgi:pyruvate dehydrogenase E1 component